MPLFRPGWTDSALRQSSGCFNALVAQGTWIRGFSFFREWHQDGIATNGRRLVEASLSCTMPGRLPNAKQCYEETTQKQTVCLNIIICRYLFRLKLTTNHCKYDMIKKSLKGTDLNTAKKSIRYV